MPASEEGAAPVGTRPWTGIGDVGQREDAWRLASREQPQRVRDRGQELPRCGSGKRDAGLRCGNSPSKCATMDRNWPSQGQGARIPACDEGTPPARDRNWPSQGRGTAMLAGEELAAPASARPREGGGHLWDGEERCRLAKREHPQPGGDRKQEGAFAGRGKSDAC